MNVTHNLHRFRILHWGGRPLLAYPDRSRLGRIRSVRLFPARTIRRKTLRLALLAAVATGLDRLCCQTGETLPIPLTAEQIALLLDRLGGCAGVSSLDWLITWPPQWTRKRVYLIVRVSGSESVSVVKIGHGAFEQRHLRNEAEMLGRLAAFDDRPFGTPSLLFLENLGEDGVALALDGVPARLAAVSARRAQTQGDRVIAYLQSRESGPRPVRVGSCPWFSEIGEVEGLAREASDRIARLAGETVHVAWAHGDLGAGNMLRAADGSLLLADWEQASLTAPCATDRVGLWLARRQGAALRVPARMVDRMIWDFRAEPQTDILLALAYLHAHRNVAATAVLNRWKETSV